MNFHLLRRQGSDEDKQALLRALHADKAPPTFAERMGLWLERMWPQVRIPTYATGFALALAAVTSFGVVYTQSPIAAPEIQDMEFGGSSAVVFESTTDPATLIWLTDADEEPEETEDEDAPNEGEEF